MKVKLFYANWHKTHAEDDKNPNRTSPGLHVRVACVGDFLVDRPDLYDLVFEWDFENDARPEDFLFEQFNIGDRGVKRIRSMSVGDVVVYNGKAVVCQGMGWKTVDAPAWALERTDEVDEQDDGPEMRIARRG